MENLFRKEANNGSQSRFSNSLSPTLHVVEIKSDDVEAGLNKLLDTVKELYGGEVKPTDL